MIRQEIKISDKKQNVVVVTGETHVEEQERIKNEFKLAAVLKNEEDDDDGLLKKRPVSEKQIENEKQDFENFLVEEAKRSKPSDVNLLRRFWGDESTLDETDRFLRKYIMGKAYNFFIMLAHNIIVGLIKMIQIMRPNLVIKQMKKMKIEIKKLIISKKNIILDLRNQEEIMFKV